MRKAELAGHLVFEGNPQRPRALQLEMKRKHAPAGYYKRGLRY